MQKAKSIACQDRFGDTMNQFSKLPSLVQQIQEKDPSASVFLDLAPNSEFIRFFWSYGVARTFGNLQRKLFSIDGAVLKNNPKLTFLVLASEDMESNSIILAAQITKFEESEAEWSSFLQRCMNHIENFNSDQCGIISDRDKGLFLS